MEKKDIALKQLRSAAKLYKSRDYISTITLAGAAEEILGQIAKKRTKTNEMEKEAKYSKNIYSYFAQPIPPDKVIVAQINKIKNELKHNDSGENSWIESDFENEANLLFVRAVKNYFNAYNEMPKDKIITSLFDYLTL